MENKEFTTKSGVKVEVRPYLPHKYARKQQAVLLEGLTTKSAQDGIDEVPAVNALKALDVLVEGMVLSVNGSSDVASKLGELSSPDYEEIANFCTEIKGDTDPKA